MKVDRVELIATDMGGRPISGAVAGVGCYINARGYHEAPFFSTEEIFSFDPKTGRRVQLPPTDNAGRTSVTVGDLGFDRQEGGMRESTAVIIMHWQQGLGAIILLSRKDTPTSICVVLRPLSQVVGHISIPRGVDSSEIQVSITIQEIPVIYYVGRSPEFHLLVPPGHYRIEAYGMQWIAIPMDFTACLAGGVVYANVSTVFTASSEGVSRHSTKAPLPAPSTSTNTPPEK